MTAGFARQSLAKDENVSSAVSASDLFISYSRRESKEFVTRLIDALEQRGKDPWVDLEDIPPASQFMEDLKEGIGGSDAFCFVLSPGAVESEYCLRELEYAVERNKRIIPIAHRALAEPPPEPLSSHSWVPQDGAFDDDFETAMDQLVEALDTDIDWVRGHTHWGQRAEGWQRGGRDRGALLRGQELREAETWLAGQADNHPAPTPLHTEFILRSQSESRSRTRRTLLAVAAALVIALVLAGVAFWQRSEAIAQRDRATSRALAANAFRVSDPTLTVLLAEEAIDRANTTEADSALRAAIQDLGRLRAFTEGGAFTALAVAPDGTIYSGARTGALEARSSEPVGPHGFRLGDPRVVTILPSATAIAAVAVSPDGDTVAVGGETGPVRILNAADANEIRSLNPGAPVSAIAFSPNGPMLATGGTDGTVSLWDAESGRRLRHFTTGAGPLRSLTFTAAGPYLVTAGTGGRAQLWRLDDESESFSAPGTLAALSPDASRIVVANEGDQPGMLSIYSVDSGMKVASVPSGSQVHTALSYTPDGKQIVAAGNNGTIRLHRADDGELRKILAGHKSEVSALTFAADGRFIVSASADATIRVWEADAPDVFVYFPVGDPTQWTAKFSPDGERVAIGGADGIKVFDARTARPLLEIPTQSIVLDLDFSPDGTQIVAGEESGVVRVWDAADGHQISEFGGHDDNFVTAVDYSPDGRWIASTAAQEEQIARIWSAAEGSQQMVLDGPRDKRDEGVLTVRDVEFSPDGSMIATGTEDGARIWDAQTGEPKLLFEGHGGFVSGVSFTPSGNSIASAGPDGSVRVWDPHTGRQTQEVRINQGAPIRVETSYDGNYAIAGYPSRQAAVVELTRAQFSGGAAATLGGFGGRVLGVDFSPNDFRAVAVGEGGVAILDTCTICLPIDKLRELAAQFVVRQMTEDERRRFVQN